MGADCRKSQREENMIILFNDAFQTVENQMVKGEEEKELVLSWMGGGIWRKGRE